MPELPEVQAAVDFLQERLEGTSLKDISVLWHRSIATHKSPEFRKALLNATFKRAFRRAKFIGLEFSSSIPLFLFIHLRMTGTVDVIDDFREVEPHDRVIFTLNNGKSFRFNDVRKFGKLYLYESLDALDARLGIEPLSEAFTPEVLFQLISNRNRQIKPLLLDQGVIAGLGNIYVDECLWKAQIHPCTVATKIPPEKVRMLHSAILTTLTEAIRLLGTDFGDGVVEGGMYQPVAYGRTGMPCNKCQNIIEKITVGQRGTHICPVCQLKPRNPRTKHYKK